MTESRPFDFEGVFDADYLYFYETQLTAERNDHEVELIDSMLQLPSGAEILDAPCGHGRISNRLAKRGFRVTGLDATRAFLERAQRDAESLGVTVDYHHGDLRDIPWQDRFDAAINWFTSFGYFGDDADRDVLRGFRAALKPRGALIIETLARDRVIRNLPAPDMPPRVLMWERDDDLMLDRITFDELTGCTTTERIVVRNGHVRRTRFTVRTFTFPEIRDWLLDAGFTSVDGYGAEAEPFGLGSTRMIVVARR